MAEICIYYGTFAQNAGIMKKISSIFDAQDEKEDGHEFDVGDADINIDKVTFAYNSQPVLKDITCTILKGKVTAIVGTNGAGKTTLFKLLERMYPTTSGKISFGDTDVSEFNLSSWRKSFAIVAQNKPLLSGTVRDNILYGVDRKVSEEELIKVAKMANVYDFVMATPGEFDAEVGPGGSNFSGGQQQCIAIARAMMRNPDYLLLDEATSNLDAKSEQLVSEALKNLMKGRTTILIAHNYSATLYADQVIVMDDGQVKACGTPDELLKVNEYYRKFAHREK
jgi:ATP-binding cassette subfamily B protein AbcA/BmrA